MKCGECMHLIHVCERRVSRSRRVIAGYCLWALIKSPDYMLREPPDECAMAEISILITARLLTPRAAR